MQTAVNASNLTNVLVSIKIIEFIPLDRSYTKDVLNGEGHLRSFHHSFREISFIKNHKNHEKIISFQQSDME